MRTFSSTIGGLQELSWNWQPTRAAQKAEYILNIWDHFTRLHTVHQVPSDLQAARESLSLAEKYRSHGGIKRWIADQNARLRFVDGVGPVDRATAQAMGGHLLMGLSRSCSIKILRESDAAYLLQLSVPHGSHKEWLLIDKVTGRFRYSGWWPDGEGEPRWFEPNLSAS